MRLFILRMIFLSLNSILVLFIVFFLLMTRPWSLEDNASNLQKNDEKAEYNELKTEMKTYIWNLEAQMKANLNEMLMVIQKRD